MISTNDSRSSAATVTALVKRFIEAWSTGDLDAVMDMIADDCVFTCSVGPEPGTTFTGTDEVRRGFAMFLPAPGTGPPDDSTPEILAGDGFAITRWSATGVDDSGNDVVVRACDLFTVRDGLITLKDTYKKIQGSVPAVG